MAKVLAVCLRGVWLLGSGLLLAACSKEPVELEQSAPVDAPDARSVVVFAADDDKTYLPTLFNEFTQETGIIVVVRNGAIPGIVDDVIESRTDPLADVLITPSAYDIWRVSEEGELRPNYSELVTSNIAEWARDPDKYWLALGYRHAEIIYDPEQIDPTTITAYEDLAGEDLRRKLCLSTSALAVNRSVIAMLMQRLGRREAELAVRGWVANLAQPPLESEADLVQALARGDCAIGIASSGTTAGTRLQVLVQEQAAVEIQAVGVTRHAHNPEDAFVLVDWLVREDVQRRHAEQTGLLPAAIGQTAAQTAVQAAAGAAAATQLAERARYP